MRVSFTLAYWLVLPGATAAFGDMLDYVTPRGGSVGTTVEVVLNGTNLQDPKEVLFYDSCIRASDIVSGAKPANEVKARLTIAQGCTPGEHILRLRTATALSEPATFWVSRFPAVKENEKRQGENDTPPKAQIVPLNSTVEGELQRGRDADVDYYRVEIGAGERLSVEVECTRLGTVARFSENEIQLRILGPSGKVVAESNGSTLFVQDPLVSILTPEAGPYFIEIRQQLYAMAPLAYYRAHIGSFSRPLGLFPAGGERGQNLRVRVLGDPKGERTESVVLPEKPGDVAYYSGAPGEIPPSPNRLRVSPYPNVTAADGPDPTPVASLPIALNGILDRQSSASFLFSAKKADTWRIQVFARSLGSPMDPILRVRPLNSEKPVLEADDAKLTDLGIPTARNTWALPASLDPLALFTPPADGEYILEIADAQGRSGPLFVYRIEIEPVRDTILTHISTIEGIQVPRLLGIAVPRGSRWTVDVQIAPGLGSQYKGDLILEAKGLPRGVEMVAPVIPKGQNRVPVQFYASDEAEDQIRLFTLQVRAADRKVPIESHSHQSFALMTRGIDRPLHVGFLDRYAMAVTRPAPFRIEVETPKAPLLQTGELALKIHIARDEGFKDPIELSADWLPANVSKTAVVTIVSDKTEAEYIIHAGNNAPPGTYQFALNAETATGQRFNGIGRIRISSAFVPVTIAAPLMKITMRRAAVEQGRKGEITASVEPAKSFQGEAVLTLKSLPKGVKLVEPKPRVTADTREVVFTIEADADALAGLYKDIGCDIAVTINGETVHQQSGSALLRVDPARTTTTAAGAQ